MGWARLGRALKRAGGRRKQAVCAVSGEGCAEGELAGQWAGGERCTGDHMGGKPMCRSQAHGDFVLCSGLANGASYCAQCRPGSWDTTVNETREFLTIARGVPWPFTECL